MKKTVKKALLGLLACVLVLALLEGLVSLGMFAYDLATGVKRPLAERTHTRFDPELGWVNVPGAHVEDLYGEGRDVSINAQGFRGVQDVTGPVPPGRVRVVCSGDSFTFGYGVADTDSWVQQLARHDDRLETVNMGQGGYGLDQAYLWYLRDGDTLPHQVHVMAVVRDDFRRMTTRRFLGYGKPYLQVENGRLVPGGVPVDEEAYGSPWVTQNLRLLQSLRMTQLMLRGAEPPASQTVCSFDQAMGMAVQAMRILDTEHKKKRRALVFVFLPTQDALVGARNDVMRTSFMKALRGAGIAALDLVADFPQLSEAELRALFIQPGEIDFLGAEGHYTVSGNRVVAQLLYERLMQLPAVVAQFEQGN